MTHTTRDGRKIIVESRHVLLTEADGRQLVLETNNDISERKQAESELLRLQLEMGRVERLAAFGKMASAIANELGSPLNSVLGYAQLMLGTICPSRARQRLTIIENPKSSAWLRLYSTISLTAAELRRRCASM